jgi:hypothetical protein
MHSDEIMSTRLPHSHDCPSDSSALHSNRPFDSAASRISVVAMTGATIVIDDASAADSIMSAKERVFALNPKLPMLRQQLMYRPGPHGIHPLADDETLGGAGVAQDGTAELDVLMRPLTEAESVDLGEKVCFDCRVAGFSLFVAYFNCCVPKLSHRRCFYFLCDSILLFRPSPLLVGPLFVCL